MTFSKYLEVFKRRFTDPQNLPKILFLVVFHIYLVFGLQHLSNFITADEHFWLPNSGSERIEDYWKAVRDRDWENTRVNDKPGITLAYTSGIALLFDDSEGQIIESDSTFKRFDPERTKELNFLYRLPILLLSGFFSFFFFWIIRKITGDAWIALFAAAGTLLSPILLGISQIVNPDSLFWIFGAASFFSFFAFLQSNERRFSIMSGIFFGLGLASKYVMVIFIPFFLFSILAYYFMEFGRFSHERSALSGTIRRACIHYLMILLGAFAIFAVMMPASFVEPKVFYVGTIGFPGMEPIFWATMATVFLVIIDAIFFRSRFLFALFDRLEPLRKFMPQFVYFVLVGTIVFVLVNWMTRNSLIDLSDISFDLKRKDSFGELPFYRKYFVEFVPLVFALTPIALFSLTFSWIRAFFVRTKFDSLIFLLSSFFLVFYAAVIEQGLLVTVRYSIILFPFAAVLSAIAIRRLLTDHNEPGSRRALQVFALFLVLVGVLFCSSTIQQNYFDGEMKSVFVTNVYRQWYSLPLFLAGIFGLSWALFSFLPWKRFARINLVWTFVIFVAIYLASILMIRPYYFSYTNDLLPKKYIISGAWGYGGYEAAQYLNALPDAKNLTVWVDSYGVCEFFVGRCIHKSKVNTQKYKIDYYFRSLQATVPLNFPHPMEDEPIWKEYIDGRSKSFLKLYKALPVPAVEVKK